MGDRCFARSRRRLGQSQSHVRLAPTTVASICETTLCALSARPERIALFGYAHVPWMKANQRLIDESALPGTTERFEQQAAAAEILAGAGYARIGLDHFALAADSLAAALATGAVKRNFQGYTTDGADTLLGFGASAIGRLPGGYVQNAARTPDWRASIQAGALATRRGISLSEDDRMRADVIGRLMCDMTADLDEIAMAHRIASDEICAEAMIGLKPFIDDGLAEFDGRRVTILEAGRPFARAVCAVFDCYFKTSQARHSGAV